MHISTPREQAIIRTVALLQMLKRRVGASSVYAFAEHFDSLASPEVPTQGQGKNGWQALFNGARPLSADRLKALASVPVWKDAEALYDHGPDGLWLAMWGPLESLKGMFGSELAESKTFDQLLVEFEGDLLVAEACRELLSVRPLARSVALYRIYRGMARLAPLELDGGGTVRCVTLCMDDVSTQLELDALGVWPFVHSELRHELKAESNAAEPQSSADERWNVIAPRLTWAD